MMTPMGRLAAGLLVGTILGGPVLAQAVEPVATMNSASQTPFGDSAIAGDETLKKATAREDISMLAQSQSTSTVSNSSVSGTSTTGTIQFNDNAFQGASGMTVINANSGNNVAMNASLNVNIVMTPPQQ